MPFDFACPDWLARLEDGRPPMADLDLDGEAVARAVGVFDNLRLPDVAGQPLMRDACGDWFRSLVGAAFGSADPITGERAVGEIFCLVPKKNSKTTNSAALGLTAMLLNKTPGAEMLIIGPTKEIADTCFRQAKGMIDADPEDAETGRAYLRDRFHVADHEKKITCRVTGATLKIKAFDMRVVTGSIPVLCIIDELHVLGSNAHAQRVLGQIRGGMITRPDSLLLFITTQSDEPPRGVFRSELTYARRVRDGDVKDGNLLPVLYELPEALQIDPEKPWRDPKYWPLVLPNLGRSITIDRLMRLYRKALEKGPDEELRWASQHLNLQLGMGKHAEGWIAADFWPAAGEDYTLKEFLDRCEVVTAGIDGGGLDDLLGLGLIGREVETKRWLHWGRAWCSELVLERRKDIAPLLRDFEAEGDLVILTDPTQDLREVAGLLAEVSERGLFPAAHAIGLDPYGVAALVDELAAQGLEGDLLVAVGQGSRLTPAIHGAERKLQDGTLRHARQGLMAWAMGNAKIEQRGSAVTVTKAAAGRAKIDPVIGLLNAFTLMSRNPEAEGETASPWDDPAFSLAAQ
jgi:phage terminase large subunit-like protein